MRGPEFAVRVTFRTPPAKLSARPVLTRAARSQPGRLVSIRRQARPRDRLRRPAVPAIRRSRRPAVAVPGCRRAPAAVAGCRRGRLSPWPAVPVARLSPWPAVPVGPGLSPRPGCFRGPLGGAGAAADPEGAGHGWGTKRPVHELLSDLGPAAAPGGPVDRPRNPLIFGCGAGRSLAA
jgi:hypothetical protein